MKICVAAILSALAATLSASPVSSQPYSWSWTACPAQDPSLTISKEYSEPANFRPGDNVTFTFEGHLSRPIEKGSILSYELKRYGFSIYSTSVDLCDNLSHGSNLTCPVAPGDYHESRSIVIPSGLPHGTYTTHVTATNVDGTPISCIDYKVKF